ncbi:transcriptional regulator with XRE-family HTH domain [Paenibacillus taihuensis]|uniref:Transcriptional regulator with XRE-family HTH domain n=1 Tax=Paenibacillus taihuensis TaxID=1156355 RepID=A0A3D9SBV0_9BACL|nr:helix-turn-helix transcriptional regulator [Paenibacillus taihuensis]REE91373.1 transcriptional regulator with XRE-family HTH domain [Paenibacillus taihuensis]
MSDLRKGLGERIKEVRTKRGMTLEELGFQSGMTKSALSKVEKGRVSISSENLYAISLVFNTSVDWLMTGEERPTPRNDHKESASFFCIKREVVSQFDHLLEALDEQDLAFIGRYIELASFNKQHKTAKESDQPKSD